MRFPIKFKLLLGYIFILTLASVLTGFVFYLNDQYIRAQQISILDEKAQSATDRLQDYFLTIRRQQLELANMVDDLDPSTISLFSTDANEFLNENQAVESIDLLSPSGREIAKVTPDGVVPTSQLGVALPTDPFNSALASNTATSKAYFIDGESSPFINIYTPALDASGQVIAVVKSEVHLSILPEILSGIRLGDHGVAYIVDSEGQIISHPHRDLIDPAKALVRPIIGKLLNTGYASLNPDDHYYMNEHNTEVVSSSTLISELNWVLVVEQPTSIVFDQLTYTRNLLMGSFIAALILMLLLVLFISNSIARPIGMLTQGVRKIYSGDLSSRTEVHTSDELEDLSVAFNSMAEQLSERQQKLQHTNEELVAERDRQEILLQSLTDGVLAVDRQQKIILFNAAAELITGYNQKSMLGRDVNAAIQMYQQDKLVPFDHYISQLPKDKQQYKEQGLSIHTDKGEKVLSLSVVPFKMEGRDDDGWIITFSDMTKEKEFEAMKLDFVSMAAHELRTPLTALRGYLSLIQDEASEKLNDEENKYLDRSFISANQLSSLVENLLNLSRVERGALKLSLSPILIEEVIQSSLDNLVSIAKQKEIGLFFEPGDEKHMVMADNFRVGEVITNLVANGINYTAHGGWVKVEVKRNKNMVEVSVSDNGQGIPASSISHLFTKFYRVQSTLAMGSKGTGLGLYISKAIIEAHHGKIWVESVEGKGSTFYFTLPAASGDKKEHEKANTNKDEVQ